MRRQAVAAVVLVVALAGCGAQEPSLPTLTTGAPTATTTDLVSIALAYRNCMTDAGVQMVIRSNNQKQPALVEVDDTVYRWYAEKIGNTVYQGGLAYATNPPTLTPAEQSLLDTFGRAPTPKGLMVDGVDYSEALVRCQADTGYDRTAALGEWHTSPQSMQHLVETNNAWAACVRENGYPGVQDSVPGALTDPFPDSTWIKLPAMTLDQLDQLIQACPPVDPVKQAEMTKWLAAHPGEAAPPDLDVCAPNVLTNPVELQQAWYDALEAAGAFECHLRQS